MTRARSTPHQLAGSRSDGSRQRSSRAAEYMSPATAAAFDAMCAKTPNLAHLTTLFPYDCAMYTQTYPGYSGNSRRRGSSKKLRDTHENARASSSYAAPLDNPIGALKTRWKFDPCNGAALRAILELYIPKAQWNFSPYTELVWAPLPRQLAPYSSQYAPLIETNRVSAQHPSRSAFQQPTPFIRPAFSSTPPTRLNCYK